jgi:hypothetical protein
MRNESDHFSSPRKKKIFGSPMMNLLKKCTALNAESFHNLTDTRDALTRGTKNMQLNALKIHENH